MATATSWLGVLPKAPLRMSASAGVASAPMAMEVIVTPICPAEMYSLMRSSWLRASAAPREPSSRITSRRARLERTSAYSAATKNALIAIKTTASMSLSPFTPDRRPSGPIYFEEVFLLRSSIADGTTVAGALVGFGHGLDDRSGQRVDA